MIQRNPFAGIIDLITSETQKTPKDISTIPAELIDCEMIDYFAIHSSILICFCRFGVPGNTDLTEDQAKSIYFDPGPVELMTRIGKGPFNAITESDR